MGFIEILIIAFALAFDAFTVAIATGVVRSRVGLRCTLRLSWHFGLFQAGMTIIGWAIGMPFRSLIDSFDHWLAFGLLAFVSIRMINGAFKKEDSDFKLNDPTKGSTLVLLSIATSIDALAVGMSLSFIDLDIWLPALVIGIVAAAMTAFGLWLGKVIGRETKLKTWAELAGGVVLLGIGVKILIDHGVFS